MKDLRSLQELMQNLYFERDKARGVPTTFAWLVEEIGELARAIRKENWTNLEEEFADVLAWLCSLANLLEIDLLEAAWRKYPGSCPRCLEKQACKCPR